MSPKNFQEHVSRLKSILFSILCNLFSYLWRPSPFCYRVSAIHFNGVDVRLPTFICIRSCVPYSRTRDKLGRDSSRRCKTCGDSSNERTDSSKKNLNRVCRRLFRTTNGEDCEGSRGKPIKFSHFSGSTRRYS